MAWVTDKVVLREVADRLTDGQLLTAAEQVELGILLNRFLDQSTAL